MELNLFCYICPTNYFSLCFYHCYEKYLFEESLTKKFHLTMFETQTDSLRSARQEEGKSCKIEQMEIKLAK